MSAVTLVTGATGFIGTHYVRLLLAQGIAVRMLLRRPNTTDPEFGTSVESLVVPDWTAPGALTAALRGVDTVVHLAARVHVMKETVADPTPLFWQANVEATRNLLLAAIKAGSQKFAFASSVKAMGESNTEPWTEEMPAAPVDPYGKSKLAAEQIIHELATAHGIHAPILRLPLVYGEGVKGNLLRLLSAIDRGIPLPIPTASNRRSFVYVGNVCVAIQALLATQPPSQDTFYMSDNTDLSTVELVHALAHALDRRPRLIPLSTPLLRALGKAGDMLARVAPSPITSAAVDRLTQSLRVNGSKLYSRGYVPTYTLEQGLRRTASWYRQQRNLADLPS